jgi:serine/threonine protein kinase
MKPENLLLTSNGRVLLSDFGIAKILPDIEHCQATSGTHGYMVREEFPKLFFWFSFLFLVFFSLQGPEVYADDHVHGTTFDWFCTGITLHEFLTGRRPYDAARLQKYYLNPLRDTLELDAIHRSGLSKNCSDFVVKILHPNVSFLLLFYFEQI